MRKKRMTNQDPDEEMGFFLATPAAARSAADAMGAQLGSFKGVKSRIDVEGARLSVRLQGPKAGADSARMCARRLAGWMMSLQKI